MYKENRCRSINNELIFKYKDEKQKSPISQAFNNKVNLHISIAKK